MLSCSTMFRVMTPRVALTTLGLIPSLDISHTCIKKAYIAQTLRCHPDLHPDDPQATEKFQLLSDALRVALKSLEMRRLGAEKGSGGSTASLDDSLSVLEALRRAIATYHVYRDTITNGVHETDRKNGEERVHPFVSDSLEYVSSVCQMEAVAMRQVQQFCKELPEVLCGRSCVLFEAVAFFNARYVEAMSRCVLRFSKNLPIIVNRVVKGRKKHVRYAHTKANSGFGSGSRPRQQRIEDMAMKPLVLVGVLIFDHEANFRAKDALGNGHKRNNPHNISQDDEKSTCGATSRDDIKICEELKCTIYPTDSIGDITEKIGRWEASSYERLQLELAMVDTTSLLSGILDLEEHSFAVMHHLHLSKKMSEKASLTLQKLACGLCYHDGENSHGKASEPRAGEHATGATEEISDKISRCRRLAREAASYIEGNITLIWDSQTPLVESAEEVVFGEEDGLSWNHVCDVDDTKDYVAVRHMSCCVAEMVRFSVSVRLSKDLREFLSRLGAAMGKVLEQADSSFSQLPKLLELREKVIKEEFIPLRNKNVNPNNDLQGTEESLLKKEKKEDFKVSWASKPEGTGVSDLTVDRNLFSGESLLGPALCSNLMNEDDESTEYQYRGSIQCFPRIFSMSTAQEFLFWESVHGHRVYLAQHAPAMNAINVYYNCLPYKPHPHATHHDRCPLGGVVGGWVGEAEVGVDDAVITHQELENTFAFQQWLEEVVEQSSLNKECRRIASDAGVGYLTRDPSLPLAQYLSFVKVFCGAMAVRGVLEKGPREARIATSEDTGLVIVVGTECDVRDGGRLLVPWWMDPSVLLALLHGGVDSRISLTAGRSAA